MILRRAPALLIAIVLCVQAMFVAAAAPPYVPAARAQEPGCSLSSSGGGGTLSACPDADTFQDFATDLGVGFNGLRGQSATSSLSVTSTPDGASVLLNGLPAGLTPLQTTVPAGSYLVRIERDGFAPYSTTVNVAADRPGSVSATLEGVTTDLGSFNWLRAADLIAQAGGYADGQLAVSSFVRDGDGAYWVAFVNYADRPYTLDDPIDAPSFLPVHPAPRTQLKVSGVARSLDDGATWTVVRSWHDSFSARAWTSDKFIDSQWDPVANGFSEEFTEHWMRAYYHERSLEQYWVEELIPRAEGGISIVLHTYKGHLPQELQFAYDNIANINFPGEFMGELTERLDSNPTFAEVSSEEAQSRWGVSREDLATYWWQDAENGRKIVGSDGGETPMTVSGVGGFYTTPKYQGSHEGVDYFLAYESVGSGVGSVGYILASRDGGRTLALETTYPLGVSANTRQPTEDLRIGPDGTKYLVVHYQLVGDTFESLIYEVESGGRLRELGRTPTGLVLGVAGGNNLPFLATEFDSAGNLHAAYRGSVTAQDDSTINVYYQLFPRSPIEYDSVALLTEPDCPSCVAAAAFLHDAGVAFSEDPADLPPDLAASVATEAGSAGYPVLVRIGAETVVRGGADVATISRLLGVSHPLLIESHAPRLIEGSPYRALSPQWLLMVLEDDQPRVVIERTDGVVALSLVDGEWKAAPLLSAPDTVIDAPGIGFAKHYPAFPGGNGAGFYSTQQEKPFNHIDRLADFVYLYHSASTAVQDPFGESNVQQDYTLWTTEAPEESSAYRVVESVSQLIPAAVFYVALGDKGAAGRVGGDLANYVTSEGEVADDGDRFYRVVVDLRAQDETATDGSIVGRTIGGSLTLDTETADGVPESREVSLLLLVQNTRLRTFYPGTRAASRDITSEAVHFTGDDEHWLVTNNIGLPNSIPCGPSQALVLDPFSVATFTAATVASFELGSCLAALEVAPTVLAECDSWEDAKLVLGAETITSLAGSLPIMRSEDQTNWELSYGNRDATIHRIVSLDRTVEPGAPPPCANETGTDSAVVVQVSGPFIGSGEAYRPSIAIVDRGTAAVLTAPLDQPGSLAWEREWLEFESAFLEANRNIDIAGEAVAALWLDVTAKRGAYSRQLLATRALLHCNHQGIGVGRVRTLIERNATLPEASSATRLCPRHRAERCSACAISSSIRRPIGQPTRPGTSSARTRPTSSARPARA